MGDFAFWVTKQVAGWITNVPIGDHPCVLAVQHTKAAYRINGL